VSYLCYLCLFGLSLPPVVCRRADVLFMFFVFVCRRAHVLFTFFVVVCPSYKQLGVKTNQTNTNNINKTAVLLQTTGGKDKPNKHK
jgi:hypothetical protein